MRKTILIIALMTAAEAAAQPTPVGPPLNRTDRSNLAVSIIRNHVQTIAQQKVAETNERLRSEGKSSRASLESVTLLARPTRLGTDTPNRPNSWHVRVPHMVKIKVDPPVGADRRINLPLDVNVFCDGWHTGSGKVVARSKAGPADFEGGNILEYIAGVGSTNIGSYIDSQVRSGFTPPLPLTIPFELTKCTTIGASDIGTETTSDDAIVWDEPGRVPRRPIGGEVVARPTIEVTFNRLKRLRARTFRGAVVYRDVEEILFNGFANYSEAQKQLSMREGDDVALNLATIRLDPGTYENLVVIGSVEQPPNNPRDSAFRTATKAQNYGPGTHVLEIPKWYTRPPDANNPKPTFIRVPAYALTYTVRFVDPGIVQP